MFKFEYLQSGDDVEMASDDEKGRMLGNDKNNVGGMGADGADVPLQGCVH